MSSTSIDWLIIAYRSVTEQYFIYIEYESTISKYIEICKGNGQPVQRRWPITWKVRRVGYGDNILSFAKGTMPLLFFRNQHKEAFNV